MSEKQVIDVLDYAKALEFIKTEVDKAPSRVYESTSQGCMYVHTRQGENPGEYDTEPGCLVGHALIAMGVPAQAFIDYDINVSTSAEGALARLECEGYIGRITSKASDFLRHVQWKQDDRNPWSYALQSGIDYVANFDNVYDANEDV